MSNPPPDAAAASPPAERSEPRWRDVFADAAIYALLIGLLAASLTWIDWDGLTRLFGG